jgi:hypothetical protein
MGALINIQQIEKVAICCDKVDRLSRNIFDKRVSILYSKSAQVDKIERCFSQKYFTLVSMHLTLVIELACQE